jgi:hypothetical protein
VLLLVTAGHLLISCVGCPCWCWRCCSSPARHLLGTCLSPARLLLVTCSSPALRPWSWARNPVGRARYASQGGKLCSAPPAPEEHKTHPGAQSSHAARVKTRGHKHRYIA